MNLLLHTCCAPCATHCVSTLRERDHAVTLFFSNANIAPAEEYARRLDAVRTLAERWDVPLIVDETRHDDWLADVAAGFETAPERGERCARCFRYSLSRTHRAMTAQGFDAFATSLTVSPHKPTPLIFGIGQAIGGAQFLAMDFKKGDGFRHSVRLASELGLYRQRYCGCAFSARGTQ
ncbi:MAG: epoxyqueuosine reductase QueH [Kiritimatiellaeota bacterium]|nr:epoxyqueuosine reductase QueH [Kiritimatiellota bacterium]